MIKLQKLAEPQILTDNGAEWTRLHLENIANGVESTTYLKSRYNHSQIKDQIVKETSEKCAYCESKLRHIHHGDIEHIFPKSLDESKRFEWNNLTLACEICNQNKSNLDPMMNSILDPYIDNPEISLFFCGPLAVGQDTKGISTETIIGLNRTELIEQRKERLEKIISIFQHVNNLALPKNARQAIYDNLKTIEASNSNAYTSMVMCTIEIFKPRLPNDIVA
ncbi:HNH endonuclease [Acinetobacter calcoaceticus]|uniref:HNH endonuclease n=1 Tax=Acinetobacter calcoaceticus TaxID=471 RepID=UPI0030090BEA